MGWNDYRSRNDVWGGSVTFLPNPDVPAELEQTEKQVFQARVERPTTWTITLGEMPRVAYVPTDPGNVGYLYVEHTGLYARLQWGVQGVQHEAEVDWRNGAVLQLAGDSVRLIAVSSTAPDVTHTPPEGRLVVGASAVPDAPFGTPLYVTRTVYYQDLAPAAEQTAYIPAYAVEAWLRHNTTTATYEVEWCYGNTLAAVTQDAQDIQLSTSVRNNADYMQPLSPAAGANLCRIRNTGTGTLVAPRMVYKLRLG